MAYPDNALVTVISGPVPNLVVELACDSAYGPTPTVQVSAPNLTVEVNRGIAGPPGPQGPGTVESVNGFTGPHVTLTAADVAALPIDAAIIGGTY